MFSDLIRTDSSVEAIVRKLPSSSREIEAKHARDYNRFFHQKFRGMLRVTLIS